MAAYIALGIAQKTKNVVALICTSGTAVLNFAAAIAEAYYQQLPLLILTADRPPEWIGQGDGQVINQTNIYANNVKKSYNLPVDLTHKDSIWNMNIILGEAINMANHSPYGPVHINIPLREPLYPKLGEIFKFDISLLPVHYIHTSSTISQFELNTIMKLCTNHTKIMIVAGQLPADEVLSALLSKFLSLNNVVFLADINSNLQVLDTSITHFDLIMGNNLDLDSSLIADLIISFGNDIISKKLKNFIKANKPKIHIQIAEKLTIVDTFQSVTHYVKVDIQHFFHLLLLNNSKIGDINYCKLWQSKQIEIKDVLTNFILKSGFSELQIVNTLIHNLPQNTILHTANSLSVRLASYISSPKTLNFCNRGTSGIDGCTSTAVGYAMMSSEIVVLLSGDMAFFYDRNAFWLNCLPSNLRFIVLNNAGGVIFRTLESAQELPEMQKYFVTQQKNTCKLIAQEYGIEYFPVHSSSDFNKLFPHFLDQSSNSKLIEVFVNGNETAEILKQMRLFIKENIGI